MSNVPSPEVRAGVESMLEEWIAKAIDENPAVLGYETGEPDEHLWIVRLAGEEKERFAIRFTVGQRSLRAETYVTPTPTRNAAEAYDMVLRASHDLFGVGFEIGDENGLYVAGQIDNRHVTEAELDRLLGTLYEATERYFPKLLKLCFQ